MTLGLSGCGDAVAPPTQAPPREVVIDGVAFTAQTRAPSSSHEVETTVLARNTMPVPTEILIQGGGRRVRLRAFMEATRRGTPTWDQDRFSPNCTDLGFRIVLAVAETREFSNALPTSAILGDSLPEGRYFFTARITARANEEFEMSSGDALIIR